ncbi:hypothetical protein [Lachnoclostridium phytofermentans]|nr:hypothetical protein [Lachnoclostridium phytofermentans]
MKDFEAYQMANITEDCKQKITDFENEIKNMFGSDVVLVAYEEKGAQVTS